MEDGRKEGARLLVMQFMTQPECVGFCLFVLLFAFKRLSFAGSLELSVLDGG